MLCAWSPVEKLNKRVFNSVQRRTTGQVLKMRTALVILVLQIGHSRLLPLPVSRLAQSWHTARCPACAERVVVRVGSEPGEGGVVASTAHGTGR